MGCGDRAAGPASLAFAGSETRMGCGDRAAGRTHAAMPVVSEAALAFALQGQCGR